MKIRPLFLILLVSLGLIYVIAHVVAKSKLNTWIEQQEHFVVEKTQINLLMGNLKLQNIKFAHELYTSDTCTFKFIKLKSFSIFDYLLRDEININDIALDDVQLFLLKKPKSDFKKKSKKLFNISNISIDSLDVNYKSKKYNLQAYQGTALINNVTNSNKLRFEDIMLNFKQIAYKPKEGTHNIFTKEIVLNSKESVLDVDNFSIKAKCGIEEWPSCHPNRNARGTYRVKSLSAKLDTAPIFSGIFLEELELDGGFFEAISYQEMNPKDISKTFFMEDFDNIDIPINIPEINVKNHTVRVLLKAESVDTLSFKQIQSTITNVTNIPDKLEKDDKIKAITSSKFMGSKLSVDFDFNIKDSLNTYAFDLDLAPMPFTKLNKAINYNTPVVIEKGQLQQLECEVTGNNLLADGQCTIAYKDLYIGVTNKKGEPMKLLNKALNFIVKDGTSKTDSKKSKNYSYTLEREESKDFFYQAYTTILQILKETMLPI